MSGDAAKRVATARTWIEFWDGDHAVYVNERHKQLNARLVADDIIGCIPAPSAVVLDFGCGEALYASAVKARCGRLVLCDAADTIRARLADRLAGEPGIEIISPDQQAAIPDGSLDVVIVMSVIQYIDGDGLGRLLDLWHRKLKENGKVVLADVVPPDVSPVTDAMALLRLAWRGGFLLAAAAGLVRTALSSYGRIRKELGFTMYTEAELEKILARHGYAGKRVYPNFLHNQARMTFHARKATLEQ